MRDEVQRRDAESAEISAENAYSDGEIHFGLDSLSLTAG
jgi:hypothetical protein